MALNKIYGHFTNKTGILSKLGRHIAQLAGLALAITLAKQYRRFNLWLLLWSILGIFAWGAHALAQGTIPGVDNPIFLPFVSKTPLETNPANGLPLLYISEFMASNHTTLADEDGEHADWLELFNGSADAVNLQGWSLTDDAKNLTKWQLPSVVIQASAYLVIFASDKNRTSDPAHLHTNFNLTRYAGYLALVKPDGKTIAWQYTPDRAEQYSDVSYGMDKAGHARYFLRPSPGAPNGTAPEDQGPALANVHHQPEPVRAGQALVVTAVTGITPAPPQLWLYYRVMYDAVVPLPMLDDGLHGDGAAHDGVYGAIIPADAYAPGQMVRYFVTATDSANRTTRLPLFRDPTNEAEYYGTVIQPDYTGSPLPVVHWFVQDYNAANRDIGTRASLYYAGEFYDNVFVRQRGDYTRQFKKKSYKFDLTAEHPFRFAPQEHRVTEVNLNSIYTDRAAIQPILAWDTYRDAGVPYSISFPVRLQRNGGFQSVAIFVEQPDENYLARQGLDPEGALYKMHTAMHAGESDGFEKKTRQNEDNSDYNSLRAGLLLPADARRRFLYDNFNLPEVLNYLAVTSIIHDNDAVAKNYYLYRDTNNTREWKVLPWDKDLTFGRMYAEKLLSAKIWSNTDPYGHPFFGNQAHQKIDGDWNQWIDALYAVPEIREMYVRRLRTLMDQLLQTPETPYSQRRYEKRIDALNAQMQGDLALDAAAWPPDWAVGQSFSDAIAALKSDFLPNRRVHLFQTHGPTGDGIIPAAQPTAFNLNFGELVLDYATPTHDQEYFTVVNPNNFAADISGWRITGDVAYTFQPGVVIPAGGTLYVAASPAAFRNRSSGHHGGEGRFVQGGYQKRLSAGSGNLNLQTNSSVIVATLGFVAPPSDLAGKLAITELNYHPQEGNGYDGEEFEFVELKNISDQDLDIRGAQFIDGIDYTFPAAMTLHPGAFAVLVRNQAAFQLRYPDVAIAGIYTKKLSNQGERLTLSDKLGRRVFSFAYNSTGLWPTSADGGGYTLVNVYPQAWPDQVCNWRASAQPNGAPGKDDEASTEPTCPNSVYLPISGH